MSIVSLYKTKKVRYNYFSTYFFLDFYLMKVEMGWKLF